MEQFIIAMHGVLIPQVVAGLIGGVLGAMMSIKIERFGWRLSILFGVGSIIGAGAVAEYLTHVYSVEFILLHCGLGILFGIVGNAALDAINLAAPEYMRKVVRGTGDGLLAKIKLYLPSGRKKDIKDE